MHACTKLHDLKGVENFFGLGGSTSHSHKYCNRESVYTIDSVAIKIITRVRYSGGGGGGGPYTIVISEA